jgi:hypothetical protein
VRKRIKEATEARDKARRAQERKERDEGDDGRLRTDKGALICNVANIEIELAEKLPDLFYHDAMLDDAFITGPIPGFPDDGPYPRRIKGIDETRLQLWAQKEGYPKVDKHTVCEAMALRSYLLQRDPLREEFDSLVWDGKPRIKTWLRDHYGVADTIYSRRAGRNFLIGAVARIYDPGCKFDSILILHSDEQGFCKSTSIEALAGDERYFSDQMPDLESDEVSEHMEGCWLIELSELAAMRKTKIEQLNSFVTRRKERYRRKYARRSENHPRRCAFVGTTNKAEMLFDPTGGRRFDVVTVTIRVDLKKLKAARSQLLAEAVHHYKAGCRYDEKGKLYYRDNLWWTSLKTFKRYFAWEQSRRRVIPNWEAIFAGDLADALNAAGSGIPAISLSKYFESKRVEARDWRPW